MEEKLTGFDFGTPCGLQRGPIGGGMMDAFKIIVNEKNKMIERLLEESIGHIPKKQLARRLYIYVLDNHDIERYTIDGICFLEVRRRQDQYNWRWEFTHMTRKELSWALANKWTCFGV